QDGSPPCTYSISPDGASFGADGGGDSVSVAAPAGCDWTAESQDSWISVSGSGSGDGTVGYSVDANPDVDPRTGTMTIAGLLCTGTQDGSPPSRAFAARRARTGRRDRQRGPARW